LKQIVAVLWPDAAPFNPRRVLSRGVCLFWARRCPGRAATVEVSFHF
jgi:hypothetical protein